MDFVVAVLMAVARSECELRAAAHHCGTITIGGAWRR
jgi:hypothetical protein